MILGRTGFARKGNWIAAVTYDALDIVTHEGKVYIGRRESVGSEPSSESNDWAMLPGAPSFEIEETASGYDLTITGSDGTSETISILNGEVDREELEDALEAFRSSTDTYFAPDYDDTATYSIGDSCIYEGRLYRCVENIPTAEPWTAEHWEPVVLSNKVAQMRKDAEVKADVVVSSAEPGDVVSFDDGADNVPVKELVVGIEPVQSGSGDPSPTNIRPISGWTGITIWDDPVYGGNIDWNQLAIRIDDWSKVRISITVDNNVVTFQPTTAQSIKYARVNVPINHKYLARGILDKDLSNYGCTVGMYDPSENNSYNNRVVMSYDGSDVKFSIILQSTSRYYAIGVYLATAATTSSVSSIRNFQIFDLTRIFGAGNEPQTESEFNALFSQDYYPYNPGEITTVSKLNGDPYREVSIDLQSTAGTVYGGSLDVTSGVLTDEIGILTLDSNIPSGTAGFRNMAVLADGVRCEYYPYRALGKGDSAKVYSDRFANRDATTGTPYSIITNVGDPRLLVCLPLEYDTVDKFRAYFASNPLDIYYYKQTPATYQLTPAQIRSLFGTNVFWSNSNGGIQSLRYVSDLKLYLEQLTKPTEDDMVANSNIPANTYFNVGNVLYLSTAAIAAGEKIEPDTNCTRKSLADALNDLHD